LVDTKEYNRGQDFNLYVQIGRYENVCWVIRQDTIW
jgi:hypothetical protein